MFETVRARLHGLRGQPRRPRPRRLGIERLEARDVPAAANPLATLPGDVTMPHEPDWVQMQVQTPGSDRVLLTFESHAADGSAFEPGRLKVFDGDGTLLWSPGQVNDAGYTLRSVSAGTVFARVAAAGGTTGAFEVTVRLAGDVTGDQVVDAADLNLIRALRGVPAGDPDYVPAADVNHNGMIGLADLRLARRNLGDTAVVGPLTADQFFLAGSDALGLRNGPRANPALRGISLVIPNLTPSPIVLESFSWGVHSEPGDGGGGGAGRPVMTDLSVTKQTDAASPLLFDAIVRGTPYQTGTLNVTRRSGGQTHPYIKWEMEDVIVTSYQISGAGGDVPHEQVSVTFAKLYFEYTPTLPNGKPGDPVARGWDFEGNRPWSGPGGGGE